MSELSLQDLENRAKQIGVSNLQLCKDADVSYSAFVRGKSGKTSMTLDNFNKLERTLTKFEQQHGKDE